ncbi:MAG: phosphatase PAP2 family protein, partial [Terriglobales bacterium]
LLLIHRRWGALAAALALFLAFARVYVGVHYPTDVAGGLLIGATVGLLLMISRLRSLLARLLCAMASTRLRTLLTRDPQESTCHSTPPTRSPLGNSDSISSYADTGARRS